MLTLTNRQPASMRLKGWIRKSWSKWKKLLDWQKKPEMKQKTVKRLKKKRKTWKAQALNSVLLRRPVISSVQSAGQIAVADAGDRVDAACVDAHGTSRHGRCPRLVTC